MRPRSSTTDRFLRVACLVALGGALVATPAPATGSDPGPAAGRPGAGASCPADAPQREVGTPDAMARLRERMAAEMASAGGAPPQVLDGSGYGYGGDGGSVGLPGALRFEATLPR
jgi:hypothetical protein